MKIVVTGSNGFIGGHLIPALRAWDPDVTIAEIDLVRGKGDDLTLLDAARPDGIGHPAFKDANLVVSLAAFTSVGDSIDNPDRCIPNNGEVTRTVLEACRQHGIPLIHASSDEVYGNVLAGAAGEDYRFAPTNPYAASKVIQEALVSAWAHTYGVKAIVARLFSAYGPGCHGAIPYFVKQIKDGGPITIHGDGTQERDLVWVGDTCAALIRMVGLIREPKFPGFQIFNVASGRAVSLNWLVDFLVGEVAPSMSAIPGRPRGVQGIERQYVEDRPGQVRRKCGHSGRLLRATGWRPEMILEDGLREYVGNVLGARAEVGVGHD